MRRDTLSRRQFVGGAIVLAGTTVITGPLAADSPRFAHGVASGDPLGDRVILWTRITPASDDGARIRVDWEIAEDAAFERIASAGHFETGPERDYTVKIDADGLAPGRAYYYRFRSGDAASPVGRTRTLPPAGVSAVTLAFVSCSNYPQGYFNVYRELAKRDDLDAVLHLGDYIYELPAGVYADPAIIEAGRQVVPSRELQSLSDYRLRHALYKSDADLQAAHGRHPFIAVWDDHEIANDSYWQGAQNHQPEKEGDWAARRRQGVRAYFEWMPIREQTPLDQADDDRPRIYRSFDFGDLASLMMLDTRLIGRDKQLDYRRDMPERSIVFDLSDPEQPRPITSAAQADGVPPEAKREVKLPFEMTAEGPRPIRDWQRIQALQEGELPEGITYLPDAERFEQEVLWEEDRQMLGAPQEQWLAGELKRSRDAGIAWQVLGQQVLMGHTVPASLDIERAQQGDGAVSIDRLRFFNRLAAAGLPFNLDAWDGYPAARERVFEMIKATDANAVTLAGDTHNAWAFDLTDRRGEPVAVELGTCSVSSPGIEAYLPLPPEEIRTDLVARNDQLRYADLQQRGYATLTLRADHAEAQFTFVSTVKAKEYTAKPGPRFRIDRGTPALKQV